MPGPIVLQDGKTDQITSPPPAETARAERWRPFTSVLVVAALLLGGVLGWFAATRSADGGEDVPAANTELVAEWTDAVRDRDPERISRLYDDDAVWYDEAGDDRFTGRFGVYTGWDIFSFVRDVVAVDLLAVTADRAVVRWDFTVPGDKEVIGISVLEIDDGQISAETVYYDSAQAP